jgi:hypothetical protein
MRTNSSCIFFNASCASSERGGRSGASAITVGVEEDPALVEVKVRDVMEGGAAVRGFM